MRARMNRRLGKGGAAAVEFALMTPMLVLLTMGIADFGSAAYTMMEVKSAAHAGVMYAYANPKNCTSSGITTAEGTATSLGNTLTTTATGATTGSPTAAAPTCNFSGCVSGTSLVSQTTTCTAGDAPGIYAVAYAKASFSTMLPWATLSLPTSISATAVMRYQ
jgi:Flp pilus assembly protein TadG